MHHHIREGRERIGADFHHRLHCDSMTGKPSDDDAVVIRQFADVRQADFALSAVSC
jgi:hypothetical protein